MLVINALTASAAVLIPVLPDYLAVGGLSLFLQTVERVKTRKLNPRLQVADLVLTMTAVQTAHDREYIPQLEALATAQGFPILGQVPRATVVRDSAAAGVPITTFAARHPAATAYTTLAERLSAAHREASRALVRALVVALDRDTFPPQPSPFCALCPLASTCPGRRPRPTGADDAF